MPLFVDDDEDFKRLCEDPPALADKADAYIKDLYKRLEIVKAQSDASSVTAEQTCSILEQKYLSLSSNFDHLQSQNAQLESALDQRLSELAQLQGEMKQLHLQSMGKDGELERLSTEASELHKSKRQLLEVVEQKDLEISEKSSTIKSYLDKILNLTDNAASREARISDLEAELTRTQAACARFSQEKELIERHNIWLNDELSSKVKSLIELRKARTESEAEMSEKLLNVERQFEESSSSLKRANKNLRELEKKYSSLQEELCSSKKDASASEERFNAELSTVNKLVELYKESYEEWSNKASELEGVIKALETQLGQVENDYKQKLEKEVSSRQEFQKEYADLKEKLERCEAELQSSQKENELNLVPVISLNSEKWVGSFGNDTPENAPMLVPSIPAGVSGTALAASLLRDGWSLAKMYSKYHEAVDALRHEQLGRAQAEKVLEQVLHEIEEKAVVILDERAEHERMLEEYSALNQKLQHSRHEQEKLEKTVLFLKADLRRQERDYLMVQKEVVDLQREVAFLLKECQDIQVRCGAGGYKYADDQTLLSDVEIVESDVDKVISERLLTFKDISGLVEQNVQLRSLVRKLSDDLENRNFEVKQMADMEIQKQSDVAATKVAAVLERSSEQARMIESLHNSVAMYKRLYEEERRVQMSDIDAAESAPDAGRSNIMLLLENSKEAKKKVEEQAAERIRYLEQDLSNSRSETLSLQLERDKLAMEASFTRERLESFKKEFQDQKDEMKGILARNVEFSQLIIDHQRKLRENFDSLQASEENSRKLTLELSILKGEKELLANSEKRACDEVHSLMERVHCLQASLDTVHVTEEVREEARCAEKKKQEDYIKQIEREWAEAKKELQDERDNSRKLKLDQEHTLKHAMRQVEDMGKELSNALHAGAAAEARAAVAEARITDLEKMNKSENDKSIDTNSIFGPSSSLAKMNEDLSILREECKRLKLEAQDKNDHMLQYKQIAEVNETALKEMESAQQNFKIKSENLKQSLEGEIISLRERISELEDESGLKSEDVAFAVSGKQEALNAALAEVTTLKEEKSSQLSQIATMEIQISVLKENLDEQHQRWHTAQQNYERQVMLQSETIQELTKTSKAFALLQDESSELRKMADAHRNECNEIKATWDREKAMLEKLKSEAETKYIDINEQNKILHGRLEALHMQLAKKDQNVAGISSQVSSDSQGDRGLQDVINYLRRSKEIAETEVALMKQEKLRLLSQLESAVKAADTAQASLRAFHANSRSALLSEEELNNLKHQVTEINLLRESNIQLREENKYNLEECQKLRETTQKSKVKIENLEIMMREREVELEACKKEVELQRAEKDQLEQRINQIFERFKNIDVEDYDRMKDKVLQMQASLTEKDALIEEIKKIVSNKEDAVAHLENGLQKSRLELSEWEKRANDISQREAGLKLDLEKQRKFVAQYKRKSEILLKEKEELSRENQVLSKQLEDSKQAKRSTADAAGEQAMKEKEKEKDTRIQILEKTVEKTRDDLRREKNDHQKEKVKRQKTENAIASSYNNVAQEKKKLENEFEKYKQDVKILSDEFERLKNDKTSIPEGFSAVQCLAKPILDALPTAYASAFENFEKVALSIISKHGSGSSHVDTPAVDTSPSATVSDSAKALGMPSTTSTLHSSPTKLTEEREKKPTQSRAIVETRKTGRKLIRPRSLKSEEPQSDVEMSEIDSRQSEIQGDPNSSNQPNVRKRVASIPVFELQETPIQGESISDVMAPVLKKFRGSDSVQESSEEHAAPPGNVGGTPTAEDLAAAVAHLPEVSTEEVIDAEKDEIETSEGQAEEQKGPQQLDATHEVEMQCSKTEIEDILEKPSEADAPFDDGSTDLAGQDFLDSILETGSDREEGEVDIEGDADDIGGGTDVLEDQPDHVIAPASPVVDEVVIPATLDGLDTLSPNVLKDEKNDEGDTIEESAVAVDKSSEGTEQIAAEIDQGPEVASAIQETTSSSTATEPGSIKQASPSRMSMPEKEAKQTIPEKEEAKQSPVIGSSSNTINIKERARQRAQIRQGEGNASSIGRGRGSMVRGRAARGRGGRGPKST